MGARKIAIPLSAIFLTEQGPVAYKRSGVGTTPVPLTLGKSNEKFAEVVSGLAEGDEVSRVVPGTDVEEEKEREP